MSPSREDFLADRREIRDELENKAKVDRLRSRGRTTVRQKLEQLVDKGSLLELGTFVKAAHQEDRERSSGDGIVGGLALIDGRPVVVVGHDTTIKGGAGGRNGGRKFRKLYEHALLSGCPYVILGESGGARIQEQTGAESMTGNAEGGRHAGLAWMGLRHRRIPMLSMIVGRSYGDSSFSAAIGDFVIQVSGTVMAVTSPRVIEVATSEVVSEEDLGGRAVQEKLTGQIDLGVDTEADAFVAAQRFLSFLPSNCNELPPKSEPALGSCDSDPELPDLVPVNRRRAYDMRKVLRRLSDDQEIFELRPNSGRSVITALMRMGGHSVGVIASQPMQMGGSITPEACDKMVRFLCLCDSFNVPIITLVDSPGFLVGSRVEHDRMLFKGMMLQQALANVNVPRFTVIVRKAFGLALFAMSGPGTGSAVIMAWPGAEISFMDPNVGANVIYGPQLAELPPDERLAETERMSAELSRGTSAYDGAVHMGIDEVIDPAETGAMLIQLLDRFAGSFSPGSSALRLWPNCW